MDHPLALTGERTLPGVAGEEYWFARHEAAYAWVARSLGSRLADAVLVEAGSGEGYGAELLRAAGASRVVALEYDEAVAGHSHAAYPLVSTVRCNLAWMPLATASVDALVTLQVVEHLWDLRGFLRDVARVVRPGGLVVVATPNRPVFSPGLGRGERPTNPFHVEELDAEQMHDLLTDAGFGDVTLHGLHHGRRISLWEKANGSIVTAQVAAVAGTGGVPSGLGEMVSSISAADFLVGPPSDAHDLIAVAVRP